MELEIETEFTSQYMFMLWEWIIEDTERAITLRKITVAKMLQFSRRILFSY